MKPLNLILASSSPRRQYLMKEVGFTFKIEKPDVEEDFPENMLVDDVAKYLAKKKAEFFRSKITDEIVVTADTVVILGNTILNKPFDRKEAIQMLSSLSGKTHIVKTGVCIFSQTKEILFDETTRVTFQNLTAKEIEFYVDNYHPFDKAGAYGAQDCLPVEFNPCSKAEMEFLESINKTSLIAESFTKHKGIGIVAIEEITGSYFNVMGLPIHVVHRHLQEW